MKKISIIDLKISNRLFIGLQREGIRYLNDFDGHDLNYILGISSLDNKSKEELLDVLRENNVLLKENDTISQLFSNIQDNEGKVVAEEEFSQLIHSDLIKGQYQEKLIKALDNNCEYGTSKEFLKKIFYELIETYYPVNEYSELYNIIEKNFDAIINDFVENNILGQDEDGMYYVVYISIIEAIKKLPSEDADILNIRLEGLPIEEIAKKKELSTDKIRQIIKNSIRDLKYGTKDINAHFRFKEDKYSAVFTKYFINKAEWISCINSKEYEYLTMVYQRGTTPIEQFDYELDSICNTIAETIIKNINNDRYCFLEGHRIRKTKKNIEEYVLSHYFRNESNYSEYIKKYREILKESKLEDEEINLSDEQFKKAESKFALKNNILWKTNKRLRYYDIESKNYDELYQTLSLSDYINTEISTFKFMKEYPDLMKNLDIRDEYELHNLLKKTAEEYGYKTIDFRRMPILRIGEFNKEEAVKELLFNIAPASREQLIDKIADTYGYRKEKISTSYISSLDQYYDKNKDEYRIDFRSFEDDEQFKRLKNIIYQDFYFINDAKVLFIDEFGKDNIDLFNTYTLKQLGYRIYSNYIISDKYSSAEKYFLTLLTKDELVDISNESGLKKVVAFNSVLYALRSELELIEFEKNKYISIRRLEKNGIDRNDLKQYIQSVKRFVASYSIEEDRGYYFTVSWLKYNGFEDSLDLLGFDNRFYSSILKTDERISYQMNANDDEDELLCLGGTGGASKLGLAINLIHFFRKLEKDELLQLFKNKFNINYNYNVVNNIMQSDEVYYDSIMETFYDDYTTYLDEI